MSKSQHTKLSGARKGFSGFPDGTLGFLRGVRANNTKTWFDAHRKDYDELYVAPAKAFVEALAPRLSDFAPEIVAEARINGSIFRINRDVRFSRDKRPYKDHLDFVFWEGEKKASASSFFFRLSPDRLFIGAGFHQARPAQLKSFREAVADPKSGTSLAQVVKNLRGHGHELGGKHYKRHPRGFPEDGPAAELLLHNALFVIQEGSPDAALRAQIVNTCVQHWQEMLPLHRWLIDHVLM